MELSSNLHLKKTYKSIEISDLGEGLRSMKAVLESINDNNLVERFSKIENNYNLMLDFMHRGFKDEQRENLYNSLLIDLYKLAADSQLYFLKRDNISYYSNIFYGNIINDSEEIKGELENFVAEKTMLDLQSDEKQKEQAANILYENHYKMMGYTFCNILISEQWSDIEQENMLKILISAIVDDKDVQLIISAITLSCINTFDINKFNTLFEIYLKTHNETSKQRALVGLVFSTINANAIYFETIKKVFTVLCKDFSCKSQIIELQKQIYFCINAEQDNIEIQNNIIPSIMENNRFDVSNFGIIEKDESSINDIINPSASEDAMEEMEKSFQKMNDMQKAGSDIYFGGFSKMKNYPFFNNIFSWFMPFSMNHPDIQQKLKDKNLKNFASNLLKQSAFCESDKYSLLFSLTTIIDKIPASMREMISSSEMISMPFSGPEIITSSLIRRTYLQDLYRFFKLYKNRTDFINPFRDDEEKSVLFLDKDYFKDLINEDDVYNLATFLYKQKRFKDSLAVVEMIEDCKKSETLYLKAILHTKTKNNYAALSTFEHIINIYPENIKALEGKAKIMLDLAMFKEAEECYKCVLEHTPNNKMALLYLSISQIKQQKAYEAMNNLYRLSIEYPEDNFVRRILAWSLMMENKIQQAWNEYEKLINATPQQPIDIMNAGYCQLFLNDIPKAISLFKEYASKQETLEKAYNLIYNDLMTEKSLLYKHGFSDVEIKLIADLSIR